MSSNIRQLDEPILEDSYPVYGDYFYVADGRVIRSDVFGTVLDLKRDTRATEIRRCDVEGRRSRAADVEARQGLPAREARS